MNLISVKVINNYICIPHVSLYMHCILVLQCPGRRRFYKVTALHVLERYKSIVRERAQNSGIHRFHV